ncbi:MAG: mechanosensitive ion channel [Veillonella sp.]|jgi:small conductance mechanosensitive channel|nr:mechanosensitive ion channel [Veillonella sp.]
MIVLADSTTSATEEAVKGNVQAQVAHGVNYLDKIQNFFIDHGPSIIIAIFVFILGRYVAIFLKRVAVEMMKRANYDHTVVSFVSQIVYYSILAVVLLTALSFAGFPTTSLLAAFGALGLAVGLALQNNLANFASGLLILMFKPFRAGDWITVNDVSGTVRSIQFMNTTIVTKEQRTVFIPNSMLTSSQVTNSTYQETRVVPFVFDIGYECNHHQVIDLLQDIFRTDTRVLNRGNVEIGIKEFGDNSVRIAAYPQVENDNFLAVFYDTMSTVKDRFDEEGINIPFPQRVVHLNVTGGLDETAIPLGDLQKMAPKNAGTNGKDGLK